MTFFLILIVAALLFGGIGLLVEAAAWALVVGLALFLIGVVSGIMTWRGSDRHTVKR